MKKLYAILILGLTWSASAQEPCSSGRYASDIFSNVTVTSGINYGSNTSWSGGNTSLALDVYEPTGDTETARPLIIWVHGGSFIGGSKTDGDVVALSQRFAKKGYVCSSIDYRLGFFPFDSANAVKAVVRATQDLKAAIRFFYKDRATTDTYRVDTNHVYIGGSSAGAITALHVAYLDDVCKISDYLTPADINGLGGLDGTSGNPGYSSTVHGVLNGCGALARYSWLEAGDVPLCSVHGTSDATVKYNRGVVNPGTPLMYLDGSRMLHERACAVGVENSFYTFPNAPHVPYASNTNYMDTTVNFVRDFLIKQLGCTDAELQPENAWLETANLYAINDCNGSPITDICTTSGLIETMPMTALVYPNPANGDVKIVPSIDQKYSIVLMDLSGRVLDAQENVYGIGELNVSSKKAGTYFIQVQSGKFSYTEQLIVY
jgi:poly(3-hydroxybutyrate) depolymerase